MFHVEKIHNRFESVNGEYYFDGEPITEAQAAHLIVHYRSVVDALKKPWDTRDDKYDVTGRLNYHWED